MATILNCTQDDSIAEAARILATGSLVVVPTDTVYGLAADPRRTGATEQIYRAKSREAGKPIVLLVSSIDVVVKVGGILNAKARNLAEKYWPGALTIVVSTGESTQGFRIPDHPVILSLLDAVGGALYVTSANRSGEEPVCTASEAVRVLGSHVAAVLDAGALDENRPSTVVRVDGESVELLREGVIPWQEIQKWVAS